ncbi:MAG: sulfate ABC transporter substrate-binding protein [Thermoguttaceae bacterium]|nr:sulfate ABC transporter substrate-binding protein [Thermoguttaceae bacterium]
MRSLARAELALVAGSLLAFAIVGCGGGGGDGALEITNVSYDPTRELYKAYNPVFEKRYEETTGQKIVVVQSHGGSGKQALEVANGLRADVVTLALEGDVRVVSDAGLIDPDFVGEFPRDSSPYTSTIVFLVRVGNPKNIRDWDDLIKPEIEVVTPNPKTSGGAMWNYLAAWRFFERQGKTEDQIKEAMKALYGNVVVLDSGARGSTTSFVENGQGDVLVAWENEAFLSLRQYPGKYEIVVPSVSILCQPTVAVVDQVAKARGTESAAKEYLDFLYSKEAQKIEAENFYRPSDPEVYAEYVAENPGLSLAAIPEDGRWINDSVERITIDHFGGWSEARKKHFAEGAIFDSIYESGR